MIIGLNEIERNVGLSIDPMGFIFRYKGKIFRAIHNASKDDVIFLFQSGAVDELQNADLIPKTFVSDFELEGYGLVLEHEKIGVISFPIEWSFTMLKDAGLLVLKVNKILLKYGFETRDSHGYNILFDHSIPKYVDFGSFGRKTTKKYWTGRDNFREFYLYTLYMWSKGNCFLARTLLNNDGKYINSKDLEFFLYRYSFARFLPSKYLAKFFYYLRGLRNLEKHDIDKILIVKNEKIKRRILKILMIFSKAGLIPNNHTNFSRLERHIKRIKAPNIKTEWGEYHIGLSESEIFKKESRFGIIINFVIKYNIQKVFEIAGNQGLFAEELSKYVHTVICSDYDEIAVDFMYQRAKEHMAFLYPVLLDFLSPVYLSLYYSESYSVYKRFKSEAVLALALTHHLLLTRKTPIDDIFKALGSYSEKYIFVEFMPLGLRKGKVPYWYNIDWFREHFIIYFKLLVETPSEKDGSRILFIGEKLNEKML